MNTSKGELHLLKFSICSKKIQKAKSYIVMYRNVVAVISTQGVEIDEGSLWSRDANLMVLVDDDQYITSEISDAFYEVD